MTVAQILQPYLLQLLELIVAMATALVGHAARAYFMAHVSAQQKSQLQQEWAILGQALPVVERLVPNQPLATAAILASIADAHGFTLTGQMLMNSLTTGLQKGTAILQQLQQAQAAAPQPTAPEAPVQQP